MTDSAPAHDAGEVVLLRRALDHEFQRRLQQAEERLGELEEQRRDQDRERLELLQKVREVARRQQEQAPLLTTMTRLMQSGIVLRWMVAGLVGVLAALVTMASAWEAIQKWLAK